MHIAGPKVLTEAAQMFAVAKRGPTLKIDSDNVLETWYKNATMKSLHSPEHSDLLEFVPY